MDNKTQDGFRLFNNNIFFLDSFIQSYGLIKSEKVFEESVFFPAPEFFLNSFRVLNKKNKNEIDATENFKVDKEKEIKGSVISDQIENSPLPTWFKGLIKSFFSPCSSTFIKQFNPDLSEVVNSDQFFFIIDILSEFIRPLIKKITKNSNDKEFVRNLMALKFQKKGDILDAINIVEGYAEAWESPELPLTAALLNLHPWVIDREKAIIWIDKAIDLFETTRDKAIEYKNFKISAKGIVAIAGINIISSYPETHNVYIEKAAGLRKMRQFAVTSMAKFVTKLLKKPERDNIVSAAYCYYLTACMNCLTPVHGPGDHTLQNLENAISLLENVHGKKNDKALADLQLLSGFFRIANAGNGTSSCLNGLKDARDCFKNACLIYSEISEETEKSISYFRILCQKAISETVESSEFYDLNECLLEYQRYSDESSKMADSLVNSQNKNMLRLAYELYNEAKDYTRDSTKKEKYIQVMLKVSERAEDKILAAISKHLLSEFSVSSKKERLLSGAVDDLIIYAGNRIKYKDYLNAGIAYYIAAKISPISSDEKRALAYSYLMKDKADKSGYSRYLPIIFQGRKRVIHKDEFFYFILEIISDISINFKKEQEAQAIIFEYFEFLLERSSIDVFSKAVNRYYSFFDNEELTEIFEKAIEKVSKNNWVMLDSLIKTAAVCFDMDKYFKFFEKALIYYIDNNDFKSAALAEYAIAEGFINKDNSSAILWFERGLNHFSYFKSRSIYESENVDVWTTLFEAKCLVNLKKACFEMDDRESALFYSQELNTLYRETLKSRNLKLLRELGKISVIPFFTLLRHHSTRLKCMKVLSSLVLLRPDDFLDALKEKSINEQILKILEYSDKRVAEILLDLAVKKDDENILKIVIGLLGEIRSDEVIGKLCSFLTGPYEKNAKQALSKYGERAFESLNNILISTEKEMANENSVLELLISMGPTIIPEILKDNQLTHFKSRIIMEIGEPAVDYLFDILEKTPDVEILSNYKNNLFELICDFKDKACYRALKMVSKRENREWGIKILRSISSTSVDILISALKNDKQRPFLVNLINDNSERYLPYLVKNLNAPDVGKHCKELLKNIVTDNFDSLIEGLKDKGLQRHCEDILLLKAQKSVEYLIERLKDSEYENIYVNVLKKCPEISLPLIVKKIGSKGYQRVCRDIIMKSGSLAAKFVVEQLHDDRISDILSVILHEMGTATVPALIKALSDSSIKLKVIKIMKKDPDLYIGNLIKVLKNSDCKESISDVIVAFGNFSIGHIINELNIGDFKEASSILSRIGVSSIGPALQLLNNDKLYKTGQRILINLHDKSILKLISILTEEIGIENKLGLRVVERIKEVLFAVKESSISEIIEVLNDKKRSSILEEIVLSDHEIAIKSLIKKLSLSSYFEFCASLLEKIGPQAVPFMIEALDDNSRRAQAAEILVRFGEKSVENVLPLLRTEKHKLAEQILFKIGPSAIIPLCNKLKKE